MGLRRNRSGLIPRSLRSSDTWTLSKGIIKFIYMLYLFDSCLTSISIFRYKTGVFSYLSYWNFSFWYYLNYYSSDIPCRVFYFTIFSFFLLESNFQYLPIGIYSILKGSYDLFLGTLFDSSFLLKLVYFLINILQFFEKIFFRVKILRSTWFRRFFSNKLIINFTRFIVSIFIRKHKKLK